MWSGPAVRTGAAINLVVSAQPTASRCHLSALYLRIKLRGVAESFGECEFSWEPPATCSKSHSEQPPRRASHRLLRPGTKTGDVRSD